MRAPLQPLLLSLLIVASTASEGCAARAAQAPAARWQKVALAAVADQPLLSGPPQTRGMRSGHVTLKAGEAMHRHSTNDNEELLVFLHGRARLQIGDEWVEAASGEVLYIPPQTPHEVHNEASEPLEYLYTVAPAR